MSENEKLREALKECLWALDKEREGDGLSTLKLRKIQARAEEALEATHPAEPSGEGPQRLRDGSLEAWQFGHTTKPKAEGKR